MLQYCLYFLGMIALPLAVEAVLAPRPCLWLLRCVLPPPRQNPPTPASLAWHSPAPAPRGASPQRSDGLADENTAGLNLPGDRVLHEPPFRRASTSSGSAVPRMKGTKRFLVKD